jgi:hypothetical protein
MTSPARYGRHPGGSVFQRRLDSDFGCRIALRHDSVGPDERQVLGPLTLHQSSDVEAVADGQVQRGPGSLPVYLEGEPRSIGDHRAPASDGLLKRFH